MAIAKIKRIEIIALKEKQDWLIGELQRLGAVHMEGEERNAPSHADVERELADILSAVNFLSRFSDNKDNFIQSFFDARDVISDEKLFNAGLDEDLLKKIFELNDRERKIAEEKKKATELIEALAPYSALDMPIELLGQGREFSSHIGYMETAAYDRYEFPQDVYIEELSRRGNHVYLFVIKPIALEINGFVEARFDEKGRPADIIERINASLGSKGAEDIEKEAKELLPRLDELKLAYDSLLLHKERLEKAETLLDTKSTVIITGYVREKDLPKVKALEGKDVAVIEHDVNPEEAPVDLEEKSFFRPFELLMKIYGTPKYGSIDPVPLVAIPFAFFFGYCLGDVGYGAVLMIISLILPKKVKIGRDGKALFNILFWGGLFSIVVGIPTGSIFGDLTGFTGLVSPLENPADLQTLMIIPICIGLIYTGFGYVLGIYAKVRNGDIPGGVFDALPWALISFSAAYLALQMLMGGSLSLQSPAIYVILASVVLVLFTHGRSHRGFGKVIYGIAGVYGIVNILSDALSFIRLFALGLSTYVLAYVFNLLANLSRGIPYLGIVLFVIILLIGHAFIFLMSGIGSFVHSLRLQYVEFFGKFFEGGEKTFRPFKSETRFFKRGE
jgi:V/A-type H+-transporting ATPase subunit I